MRKLTSAEILEIANETGATVDEVREVEARYDAALSEPVQHPAIITEAQFRGEQIRKAR